MLRLSQSAVLWYPGAQATQTICATNTGDGTLALSASVQSGDNWVTVSVGAPVWLGQVCIPLQFTIDVSSLPSGTCTASVTVFDPHAIDAPQVVTVTALVGGGDPVRFDRYMAPGTSTDVPVWGDAATANTQDGGKWLSIVYPAQSTWYFVETVYIHLAPPGSMAPGTYSGGATVGAFPDHYTPRTIPVTMRVTTEPIAVPSVIQIQLRLAQDGPPAVYPFLPAISFTNSGMGTLEVQGVAGTGEGVSAYQYGDQAIVAVDPMSRGPGIYTDGVVTIQCNGANCPVQVPVSLEIVPQASPTITFQGVVDNVTFSPSQSVAPGEVCIVQGEQLSLQAPMTAAAFPLPASLGGATVLVNGITAPLYCSSFGQIAFQMPYSTATGTALVQVVRDGVVSNTVTVNAAVIAPQILQITDANYQLRDANHPAAPGESLIFWAIGLGTTNPPVEAGSAAPVSPPAVAVYAVRVMGPGKSAKPGFVGLSGGSVGLYQVNVTVPPETPTGVAHVSLGGNSVPLAVQ